VRLDKIKITLITITGCGLLVLLLTQIIPLFIDHKPIAARISKQVQAITGENFVHGDLSVSVLRGGEVIFDGVAVRNPPDATKNYFLRADRLILHVGLFDALFNNQARVNNIELVNPSIELEEFDEKRNNWSFLFQGESVSQLAQGFEITVVNAEVVYTNHVHDYTSKLQGITGNFSVTSGQLALDLQALLDEQLMTFSGVCQFTEFNHLGSYDTNCVNTLSHPTMQMDIQGRLVAKYGGLVSKQTITAKSKDGRLWGDILFGQGNAPFSDFYQNPLPVNFTAEVYSDAKKTVLNVDIFNSGETEGKGSVTIETDKNKRHVTGNFWFKSLNYDQLALGIEESVGGENDPFRLKEGFNTAHSGELILRADRLMFHKADLRNVVVNGQVAGGALIITEATADAPANGSILTLGRVSATASGLEYDGQVEAHGDSLHELSTMFGVDYDDLPEGVFGQFRTRFNMIVRTRSTTISELRLVTGDRIKIAGGINWYAEQTPRLDASIAIKNLDFSPFEQHWLGDASLLKPPDQLEHNPFAFEWLRDFNRNVRVELEMDEYTLFDLKGRPSTLTFNINENQIALRKMSVNLGDSRIEGVAKLALPRGQERPQIESQLSISRLNLGDTFMQTMWAERQPAGRAYNLPSVQDTVWARDPVNFWPLHYFDGMSELRIRQVQHETFKGYNFKGTVKVQDSQLSVKDADMNLWGGDMEMDITVDSAVVPGLNFSFYLLNAQINDMLKSFVEYDNLSGLISISGRIGFSGLNFESWIDSINGHLALDARNVFIRDFNLPAIIRSINSLRSVSGLLNAIRQSFDSGATRIGSVNGTTYFSRGKMSVTRISFRSNESVGSIEGEFDIRRWTLDMIANFGLITLAQTGYPFLQINFDGPFEMPERSINTKSIEAFLAQELR